MKRIARFAFPAIALLAAGALRAEVKLAPVFTDHMVLQRDVRAAVWGTADPGEQVTIAIARQNKTARADGSGKWMISLDSIHDTVPCDFEVIASNKLKLQDVLVGDVWICSGQSNMGFAVKNAENAGKDIAAANLPQIRLYSVAHKTSRTPLTDAGGKWEVCTPQTVPNFTSVGFFFGRYLHQDLHVPIGLINSSWGGTVAEAWTAPAALEANPDKQVEQDRASAVLPCHAKLA